MLTATKTWLCNCDRPGCSGAINPGDQFNIIDGTFYKIGHSPEERKIQISIKPKIILKKKQED